MFQGTAEQPTRPQAALFFSTQHKGFVNKQFPENWAGPHLLVKTTPQSCQGLPRGLFTPCRSRTPPSALPLREEGSRNVAKSSSGKNPRSVKNFRSSGCGLPRMTAFLAWRPIRAKKVTWLLPTAQAPTSGCNTQRVVDVVRNVHVCNSGTRAFCSW